MVVARGYVHALAEAAEHEEGEFVGPGCGGAVGYFDVFADLLGGVAGRELDLR